MIEFFTSLAEIVAFVCILISAYLYATRTKIPFLEFETVMAKDFADVEMEIENASNNIQLRYAFESYKTFRSRYAEEQDGDMDADRLLNLYNIRYDQLNPNPLLNYNSR